MDERDNKSMNEKLQREERKERFEIVKYILANFALFSIVDNKEDKVVCHLVYDNGEAYCDEVANKIVKSLNEQPETK